ncbi:MAG: LuxR C-terminal-related transcriptional regulator [Methylobacter sp.]|uniref:response regulator transcription factor n=1 Tax=Methylobacter sp. TaxID=2051955 RepID=UPI0025F8534E|nr:LuxR C-terminal-related transcriptional regulator [Methylobacter sp.]MCK9622220.1 LuxR C-terminal-related transcriptional regulator [Methylobacter sp.]
MDIKVIDAGDLTAREADVLRCLASGLDDKRIARALAISIKTVSTHCEGIYRKMEVDRQQGNTRILAVTRAIANGVIAVSRSS